MDAAIVEMLRENHAEWAALVAALDADPARGTGDPSWTSRDVYAHLAYWMERSTALLDATLAGGSVPDPEGTVDEINARVREEYRDLSLEEARSWAHDAFERRLRAIEAVPAGRWDDRLGRIARLDGADHLRSHRQNLTAT